MAIVTHVGGTTYVANITLTLYYRVSGSNLWRGYVSDQGLGELYVWAQVYGLSRAVLMQEDRWFACINLVSRPAWIPYRPMGVSSIIAVIAAGDTMRGLLYLFAGGACPSRHAV